MTTSLSAQPVGAQALLRGLAVIDAVAAGHHGLAAIGEHINCTRSTTHRLVSALVHAGYLRHGAQGYQLGLKLATLGALAREQTPLAALARPIIEALAQTCGDSVHLGVREGDDVVYLDKVAGSRGLEMRSRPGLRLPLALTGVGRALMLDLQEPQWQRLYTQARDHQARQSDAPVAGLSPLEPPAWPEYRNRLLDYQRTSVVLDLEDNERGIRCVAAPVRDEHGMIVAAISIASATPWMSDARLAELAPRVRDAAAQLSHRIARPDLHPDADFSPPAGASHE
ncbi:IclR family transcriptional regulator [Kushneria pakistanensis]|uniref:IclR family transcriptional regulator n=1 Tax=Kushneria pakistanensis TaxID=1508770 RepID=A0ABQ3FFN7_9GAMM|nr:IclR family transcriptional regulator [Kushneria pakistanensis]GHC21917.1 IclR family transcriptional regulator [Kushneria pakistanensis]